MRFCFYVLLSVFLSLGTMPFAQAQTAEDKFSGPAAIHEFLTKKKAPPPTPEQIDESLVVYDECKASDMLRSYYDCDCLSADFLQSRTEKPQATRYDLMMKSRTRCGNTVDIAGLSYERCLTWAPRVKSNYNEYCTCYANSFAKSFGQAPTDSIRGREILMTNALNTCNTTNELAEKRSRQNLIDLLKKRGIYESLFPGAKTDPSEGQPLPRP